MTWNCTQTQFWCNSLRRDLMCCSAATQADCPQPKIPPALTGASSMLSFSNRCTCARVFVCVCARRVVLYLWESDCPQRAEPSLWLNNALCICDQVIYMRCDWTPPSRPSGHRQPTRDPASALFPRAPHCPRILYPSLDLCPQCLEGCWLGGCRISL